MKSTFLTSSAFIVVLCSLNNSLYARVNNRQVHEEKNAKEREYELLEKAICNVFGQFEESLDLFKQNLSGLAPKSKEKLVTTCKKLKETMDQVEQRFIEPMRQEVITLKNSSLEGSNYNKLLDTLLKICDELKKHFNLIYNTLHKSLQGNPSAISVAKQLKPVIDAITVDANFKKIDDLLVQAKNYAVAYDNLGAIIKIKPEYRKIIDIDGNNDSKTYHIKLTQAISLIREWLEEVRQEYREPTVTEAEKLRIIRSRL